MNHLTTQQADATITMTSLEMVEYINSQRQEGEAELRHDTFMLKVPKVLGEAAPEFSGTASYTVNGATRSRPIYIFPKREACLMAMSYSYELQAKVFDRMTELEKGTTRIPTSFADALRLAAEQAERIEKQQAQLAVAEPKALVFDNSMGDKSMSVSRFARSLRGVNINQIKKSLLNLGYLHQKGGTYRVYAKHMKHFEEKVLSGNSSYNGNWEIFPTASGKTLMAQLHAEGKLIRKAGY